MGLIPVTGQGLKSFEFFKGECVFEMYTRHAATFSKHIKLCVNKNSYRISSVVFPTSAYTKWAKKTAKFYVFSFVFIAVEQPTLITFAIGK